MLHYQQHRCLSAMATQQPVLVLWGGELSQGIAERIVAEAASRSPPVPVDAKSMEAYRKPALKALAAAGGTVVMILQARAAGVQLPARSTLHAITSVVARPLHAG